MTESEQIKLEATILNYNYMGALRRLTRQRIADAYVRMLLRAYEFSSTLNGESIDEMEKHLIECDAFKEPNEGATENFTQVEIKY